MKKKNVLIRALSLVLAVNMLFTLLPLDIWGEGSSAEFSKTVTTEEGIEITVSGDAGIFSSNVGSLSVVKTSFEDEKGAQAAIEKLRNDKTLMFSHSNTYDIKLLDSSNNELTPDSGKKVKLSFKINDLASSENIGYDPSWNVGIYSIYKAENSNETQAAELCNGSLTDDAGSARVYEKEVESLGRFSLEISSDEPGKNYGREVEKLLFLKSKDRFNVDYKTGDGESYLAGSKNWMSFISGERKLNEINIPCTHDSGTKDLDVNGAPANLVGGLLFAQVQKLYIDQQLNSGVRGLDIRLNNKKINWYAIYAQDAVDVSNWLVNQLDKVDFLDIIPKDAVKTLVGDDAVLLAEDDGYTLWVCHGKNLNVGTYYAKTKENEDLTFDRVLEYVKEFLKANPTETVMLSFEAEVIDENEADHNVVFSRIGNKLSELSEEINPSTGESYLYMKDDTFGKAYSDFPKLRDCRGKVVIRANKKDADKIGALYFDGNSIGEGEYCEVDEKIKRLENFYNTNDTAIPKDGSTHHDKVYSVGTTNSNIDPAETPLQYASVIQDVLFNYRTVFNTYGKCYGWVRFDGITEEVAKNIWKTNYTDDYKYSEVRVESGFDCSKQYYKLLKGSEIKIPEGIFENKDNFFIGWEVTEGDSSEVEKVYSGNPYVVNADRVSFKPIWADKKTPVWVIWKDGDDTDTLRPDTLELINHPKEGQTFSEHSITLTKADNWRTVVEGDIGELTINWEKATGSDVSGEYVYKIEGMPGAGYVITLSHTPVAVVSCKGEVQWDDNNNAQGIRPDSVTLELYRDNEKIDSKTVSSSDNWTYDFGVNPKYENGNIDKKYIYSVKEVTTNLHPTNKTMGYSVMVNEFTVKNILSSSARASFGGSLEWDDNDNAAGKRPKKVVINLLDSRGNILKSSDVCGIYYDSNGKAVSTPDEIASPGVTKKWLWSIDMASLYDAIKDKGGEENYKLSLELPKEYTSISKIRETGEGDNKKSERVIECKYIGDPGISKKEKLLYNGEEQVLVSQNSASYNAGTLTYALEKDENTIPSASDYKEELPKGKDAGKYFVRYKISFEADYKDIYSDPIEVHIAGAVKAPRAINPTYSGAEKDLVEAGVALDGDIYYALGSDSNTPPSDNAGETVNWKTDIPKGVDIGSYYVWYKVKAEDAFTKPLCVLASIKRPIPYYRVSFDLNGHGESISSQSIRENNKVKKPQDPVAEDYIFEGWYEDRECERAYDFESSVTSSFTIYAKWADARSRSYNVSFDLNGLEGSCPKSQILEYKALAEKPEDPQIEGYIFKGWYQDRECSKAYDFDSPVTEDLTLNAKWEEIIINVVFDLGGQEGSAPESQKIAYNASAVRPKDPVVKGYIFDGWYRGADAETEFDFSQPLKEDTLLYARWTFNDNFAVEFTDLETDPYNGLFYDQENRRYEAVYRGHNIEPSILVFGELGILKEGEDYALLYSNNLNCSSEEETAVVTVKGL
ncbi:MAG: phosphatidylinositol-specific phospholipase C domain-containing protein, partial [Lachnospiraceae bacterium]|nr:phosphatidylinositol-specific phospholipase C domain-containing protein [Lachnospiraceae bacterium]